MKIVLILVLILGIDAAILFIELSELSISYYETQILYSENTLLHYIITASLDFFGHSDIALRIPMIIMHLLSVLLLFKVSAQYLKYDKDRIWLIIIFILLPGVNSAALIVDAAGVMIFALMFYMYIYYFHRKYEYALLPLLVVTDQSIAFLYLGLIFFEYSNRSYKKIIVLTALFLVTFLVHPLEVSGVPSSYFTDTLAVYAVIFSPIVFIYLFYILYRGYMSQRQDISWYLAFTALVASLVFSFRQRIEIEFFAPYLMIALPYATQAFFNSYRVRLKEYRRRYRVLFSISFILLLINTLVVLFNKELYPYVKIPKKHFVYKMHIAKELAAKLHEADITCISVASETMQQRLQFYGIGYCTKNLLTGELKMRLMEHNVTISYKNRILYEAYVTKTLN